MTVTKRHVWGGLGKHNYSVSVCWICTFVFCFAIM